MVDDMNRLPDKEEEQDIVQDLLSCATKSNDFFGTENSRKKDDKRVYSDVVVFNEKEKQAMGVDRGESSVNPLPLYVNAVSNLFLTNPFQADAESDKESSFTTLEGEVISSKEFVNTQISQILENSDANTSVFGEALVDTCTTGGSFMYATTEDGQIKLNIAYDSTSVIFDPNSRKKDGRDAEFFGIVEPISYERAKSLIEEVGGICPDKTAIVKCNTYSFSGFASTLDAVNLVHFFRKEEGCVAFYNIVADKVVKVARFEGLSCLPVVPVYGQSFDDNNKKFYKGMVRGVKALCKIVNGCYTLLWERVSLVKDPSWLLDIGAVEGYTDDYNDDTVKYRRFRSSRVIDEKTVERFEKPQLFVPEIGTGDLLPVIKDSLSMISKILGVPEEGLGFSANAAAHQNELHILTRSTAMVTNVSHYYRHLQQSIKHMVEVVVEMLCIYNGIDNTFSIKISKGPEDALRRERLRQQLSSMLGIVPDAAKPLITAAIVRTYDIDNADGIANAILATLPKEVREALGGGNDPQALAQQIVVLQQQLSQAQAQNAELQQAQQADMVNAQTQIVMSRMNNEAALRSKLVELEAKSAEHEKDLALKYAELDESQQATFQEAVDKSRAADLKAREVAVKELATAQQLRLDAEERKAKILEGIVKAMTPVVDVQPMATEIP